MVVIVVMITIVMMIVMVVAMVILLTKSNLSWRLSIGGSLSCSASHPWDLVSHHRLGLRGGLGSVLFFLQSFAFFNSSNSPIHIFGVHAGIVFWCSYIWMNSSSRPATAVESPFVTFEWKYLFCNFLDFLTILSSLVGICLSKKYAQKSSRNTGQQSMPMLMKKVFLPHSFLPSWWRAADLWWWLDD